MNKEIMKEKEAIHYLFGKYLVPITSEASFSKEAIKHNEAIRMAIDALKRTDADGCTGCNFEYVDEWEMPCAKCKRNHMDYWRPKEVKRAKRRKK